MAGDIPIPMTAANDVVDVALRWLVRRHWKGIEGVAVHGPEDLSFAHAAATMSRVLERPVRYEQTSAPDYVRQLMSLGASVQYAEGQVARFAELARGISRAEPRTLESTTPTSLAEWCARELWTECSFADASGATAQTGLIALEGIRSAGSPPGDIALAGLT